MKFLLVAVVLLLAGCSSGAALPTSSPGRPSAAASTGNGEAAKPAGQVLDDALTALRDAGSLHAVGTAQANGKPVTFDLHLQGGNTSGTITMAGTSLELTVVDNVAYAKAPAQFWAEQANLPATAARQIGATWVKLPAQSASEFNDFNLNGLADQIPSAAGGTVSQASYDGRPVVVVTEPDGTVIDVAATGTPYPLRATKPGNDGGTLTFDSFGQPQDITAPSGAVDLSQLIGGR